MPSKSVRLDTTPEKFEGNIHEIEKESDSLQEQYDESNNNNSASLPSPATQTTLDNLKNLSRAFKERVEIFNSIEKKLIKSAEYIDYINENYLTWTIKQRQSVLKEILKRKNFWGLLTPEVLDSLTKMDTIEFTDFSKLPSHAPLSEASHMTTTIASAQIHKTENPTVVPAEETTAKLQENPLENNLPATPDSLNAPTLYQKDPDSESQNDDSTAAEENQLASKSRTMTQSTIDLADISDDVAKIKQGIIKIFSDIKNIPCKTIKIDSSTKSADLVTLALKKFRIEGDFSKYTLLVNIKYESGIDETELKPDQEVLPYILSKIDEGVEASNIHCQLHRKKKTEILRIYYDNTDGFKTFPVTDQTTSSGIIQMAMKKFKLEGSPLDYDIFETLDNSISCVKPDEKLLILKIEYEKKGLGDKVKYVIKERSKSLQEKLLTGDEIVDMLKDTPENFNCADCGAENPTFASINYGIILCMECAKIHTTLHLSGQIISKIRPIMSYTWRLSHAEIIKSRGNKKSNDFFGQNLQYAATVERSSYILSKYSDKKFMPNSRFNVSEKQLEKELFLAIEKNDINEVINLYAYGVNLNQSGENLTSSPFHEVCRIGNFSMFELFLALGANPIVEDVEKRTPLFVLYQTRNEMLANRLKDYQAIYEGILNRKEKDESRFYSWLLSSVKSVSLGLAKLTNVPESTFKALLNDAIGEANRRSLDQRPEGLDGPALRLANMKDPAFREFADNVFDELNIREFFKMHVLSLKGLAAKNKNTDNINEPSNSWLILLRGRQHAEKNDAQRNLDETPRAKGSLDSQQTLASGSSANLTLREIHDEKQQPSELYKKVANKDEFALSTSLSVLNASTSSSSYEEESSKKMHEFKARLKRLVEDLVEKCKAFRNEISKQDFVAPSIEQDKVNNSTALLIKFGDEIIEDSYFPDDKKDLIHGIGRQLVLCLKHFNSKSESILQEGVMITKNEVNDLSLACFEIVKLLKKFVNAVTGKDPK